MGEGAADEGDVEGGGHGQVVDVLGLAGEQRGVLLAQEALAHDGAHRAAAFCDPAAASTAFTMLW